MQKIIIIITLFLSQITMANVVVEELLSSSNSWDGGQFSYVAGRAKITIKKLIISKNQRIKNFHCHVVPLAAYVQKGEVEVIKKSGERRIFKAGEAFIEVMNQWHKGLAIMDTELIVFYAGNKNLPLDVKSGEVLGKLCR